MLKNFRWPDIDFITSAPNYNLLPKNYGIESAFIGRSNCGKSSLLNALVSSKPVAKTSKQPGKTKLLNYFISKDKLIKWVDLPGYGYAKVSKTQAIKIWNSIESYIKNRVELKFIYCCIDSRRGAMNIDIENIQLIKKLRKDIEIIFFITKSDKLNMKTRNNLNKRLSLNIEPFNLKQYSDKWFICSSKNKDGIHEIKSYILDQYQNL